jgi:hypothetical protein
MCQVFTYFWVARGHVTYEVVRCEDPRNCGPLGSLPNTTTEMNTFCPDCNPRAQGRRSHNRNRLNDFSQETRRNFAAHRERSERREAEREVPDPDLAGYDQDLLNEERLLMNIPPEQLTVAQAHHLRCICRRVSERVSRLEGFIETVPERLLPGAGAGALADDDPVDTSIYTLIRSLIDDTEEDRVVASLTELQEDRRVRHGRRPYLQRHRRVEAICRLLRHAFAIRRDDPEHPICSEGFGTRDEGVEIPVEFPCGHAIGSFCLQHWLADNTTCPICRRDYSRQLFNPRNRRPILDRESDNLREDYVAAVAQSEALQDEAEAAEAQAAEAREAEIEAENARAANNPPADQDENGQAGPLEAEGQPGRGLGIEFELAVGFTEPE